MARLELRLLWGSWGNRLFSGAGIQYSGELCAIRSDSPQPPIPQELSKKLRLTQVPKCSPEILDRLADDDEITVRVGVAGHVACPPETLARMVTQCLQDCTFEEMGLIRRAVVANDNCPAATIASLVSSPDLNVQEQALRHPNCPPAILYDRWDHLDEDLRCHVAKRSQIPEILWPKLIADRSKMILLFLIARSDITPEMLAILMEHPISTISTAAAHHPNCPEHVRAITTLGGNYPGDSD